MSKLRTWEWLLILLTLAFLLFICGYFVGQRSVQAGNAVVIETERSGEGTAPSAPVSPETEASPASSPAETEPVSSPAALVNINTADKETLMELPGIGEKLAERIIAYRESHGAFEAKDELMDVNGIGESKYAALKDQITVR